MILPILHISRFKKLPNELYQPRVLDFGADNTNEYLVVDIVKAPLNVAFYEPRYARKFLLQRLQGRVAISVRTKTV